MNVFLIDSINHDKILVNAGETIIGRGPFLKVTDKRVSRNHAILKLCNGILSVKPVHKNPTFFRPSNQSKSSSLPKDIWKELLHGDVISLLPEDLHFTVSIETDTTQEYEIAITSENSSEHGATNMLKTEFPTPPEAEKESGNASSSGNCESKTDETILSQSPLKKRTLPAWMFGTETSEAKKTKSKTSNGKKEISKDCEESEMTSENAEKKDQSESKEPVEEKSSVNDEQPVKVPCDSNTDQKKVCPYGSKCYRKNPTHFREYSHPEEPDNPEDPITNPITKPECEYGSNCYRKNPKHFEDYSHACAAAESKRRTRATASRKRNSSKGKSVLDNASDDDGEKNCYDYNDSFIDDTDDGDGDVVSSESFVDEDDSDFNPDDDDIDELVEEAKQFIDHQK